MTQLTVVDSVPEEKELKTKAMPIVEEETPVENSMNQEILDALQKVTSPVPDTKCLLGGDLDFTKTLDDLILVSCVS